MKKRLQHPPAYVDGVFALYNIVDSRESGSDFHRKMISNTGEAIAFRELAIFDRTRLIFEQAGKVIQMKIAIPRYDAISSNCVLIIDGIQYKVFNAASVETSDGYPETEITLMNSEVTYVTE